MNRLSQLALLATVAGLWSCASNEPAVKAGSSVQPAAVDAPWVQQARGVATAVPPKLLAVLQDAIQKKGPAQAIEVCNIEAPKMAQSASQQSGWQVRRVSQNNRNPKAVPDAWERANLEAFDRALATGADLSTLERAAVVMENGQPVRRYMRALPTLEMCVQCHGPVDKLGPGVKERLAKLYPADRATGYLPGTLRGAITLRQPGS